MAEPVAPQILSADKALAEYANHSTTHDAMRLLWLIYDRPPRPDAVSHPATELDVRLVLDLLRRTRTKRLHLAEQFNRYIAEQRSTAAHERRTVGCRMSDGLYHPVPWRLAKWLRFVLAAPDRITQEVEQRIRHWQQRHPESSDTIILAPSPRFVCAAGVDRGAGFQPATIALPAAG